MFAMWKFVQTLQFKLLSLNFSINLDVYFGYFFKLLIDVPHIETE